MQNYCQTFLFAFNEFIMKKEGIKKIALTTYIK